MLASGADDAMQLHRVRLHGARDALRARQRFEAALADLTPSSLGLPEHSLLVIRRVAPVARLRTGGAGGRSDSSRPFARAVRSDLQTNLQRARRPWLHADASSAEAVLFSDESEMAACLVRDWLRGVLAERWWWVSVLRGMPAQEWLRRSVLNRGDLLPAVLTTLAPTGEAVAWLARLRDNEATVATGAIVEAHGLGLLLKASAAAVEEVLSLSSDNELLSQKPKSPGIPSSAELVLAVSRDSPMTLRKLWSIVPELHGTTLGAEQRRLLALALSLQRAPTLVRSGEFGSALQAVADDHVIGPLTGRPPETRSANDTAGIPKHMQMSALSESNRDGKVLVGDVAANSLAADNAAQHASAPGQFDPAIASHSAVTDRTRNISPDQISASVAPVLPGVSATNNVLPSDASSGIVETGFGGIFYLLNAALALGLYGDFTQPRKPGIALSPWDWLALVGRAWFGGEFEQDPAWALLAALAGRSPETSPGADFKPSVTWAVPEEWLAPWPEITNLGVFASRTRLQIWHVDGFLLVDTARLAGCKPMLQARHLCDGYAAHRSAPLIRLYRSPQQGKRTARQSVARWLHRFMPYLEARLRRALGTVENGALARLVCCHPARIAQTATTIDIHLSLQKLPLSLRIAGLDRDPGWIPAAGRSVAFHFQ